MPNPKFFATLDASLPARGDAYMTELWYQLRAGTAGAGTLNVRDLALLCSWQAQGWLPDVDVIVDNPQRDAERVYTLSDTEVHRIMRLNAVATRYGRHNVTTTGMAEEWWDEN